MCVGFLIFCRSLFFCSSTITYYSGVQSVRAYEVSIVYWSSYVGTLCAYVPARIKMSQCVCLVMEVMKEMWRMVAFGWS